MTSQLNPYIMFDGNAREAVEFYRGILGGELEISTAADFGAPDGPAASAIVHAGLTTPAGYTLMAWDRPQGMPLHPGNNVSISVSGDDPLLREHFEKLSADGTITMPLDMQPWGDEAGALIDRFGINWMFNITVSTS